MNERVRELVKLANRQYSQKYYPKEFLENLATLIEEDCASRLVKVWYEQGLDVRGADLGKFLVRFAELSNDSVSS